MTQAGVTGVTGANAVADGFLDRPKWVSQNFCVTLWCEHSRLPLSALNDKGDKRGVYELTLPRDWLVKAAPFLKLLTGTLSLVVPVASSATNGLIRVQNKRQEFLWVHPQFEAEY